jgi:hypothetical protein
VKVTFSIGIISLWGRCIDPCHAANSCLQFAAILFVHACGTQVAGCLLEHGLRRSVQKMKFRTLIAKCSYFIAVSPL